MKKIIGERIRNLRYSKGYTQDNMAAELDITAGAYAKIERGETDPSATRLLKIAEILEVDVIIFFQDRSQPSKLQESVKEYGFATKADIENLTHLIKQLNRDIEKLKTEMAAVKKPGAKRKK